ncbi:MAG TPA: hypothetical protein VMF89_15295, partial [Polyangiales bacterium]|nr:hypothetical protein [Polyangiales bacterium]
SIDFYIQTKQSASDSYRPVSSYPVGADSLLMATASTTSTTDQWLRGETTVDEKLKAAGYASLNMLKVTMVFRPNSAGSLAPTLLGWRQIYDCVPNE